MENKTDEEKLSDFAADINALMPPDVQSDEARQTLANVLSILHGVVGTLEGFGANTVKAVSKEEADVLDDLRRYVASAARQVADQMSSDIDGEDSSP
jgi:hypothetical protein